MADVPVLMAPLLSALGLSHLPGEHPILQQIRDLRVQDPAGQPTINDLFEGILQARAIGRAAEEHGPELPELQQPTASQEELAAPPVSQRLELEGEATSHVESSGGLRQET